MLLIKYSEYKWMARKGGTDDIKRQYKIENVLN